MTAPPEANVEQVFFGWSRDGGGLGPLASSYPHPGEMHRWHARLQKHLRLQPMPGAPVPSAAFSYFVFDGIAVLVRRVSAGVSSGRNNSQALIADEDVLDFYAAIGMSIANWPDDPPENAPIRPLRADNVQGTRSRAQSLAAIVGKYDNHVGIVLAGLLADPTRPLSVIGGDDRAALATVWALHEAAIRYLPRRFAGRRDWSYSTYEDKHDAAAGELPGIVFLPTAQPGAGAVNRTIVDLSRQPLVDEAGLALAHRVIHYLVNDMTPVDTIDDTPVRKQPGMTSGPVTMPSPRPAPVAPVSSAPAPAEHSPVEALLAAVTVDDFNRELDRLEQRRSILYTSIDVAALDDLARFVEVDARNELLGRLLKLTYGQRLPGALHEPEAQKHAVKLIKRGQSDQLARLRGAPAPAGEPIREAAFERWTAGAGKPPGETNGSMSTRLRVARHSRYFWWIAGGAAVLALALVFVLGFLTGRPGNAAAPAASPAVATKAAVPTTKAPTEATQAPTQAPTQATQNNSQQNDQNQNQNAGVPVASRAGQDVWMFRPAKDGRDFFPLELCQPKSDTSWTCTPTASDGDSIVAMAVPRNSSLDLADKAKNGGKTEPQNDWSQTTQVK
jgi:hypothetical protein